MFADAYMPCKRHAGAYMDKIFDDAVVIDARTRIENAMPADNRRRADNRPREDDGTLTNRTGGAHPCRRMYDTGEEQFALQALDNRPAYCGIAQRNDGTIGLPFARNGQRIFIRSQYGVSIQEGHGRTVLIDQAHDLVFSARHNRFDNGFGMPSCPKYEQAHWMKC